MSSIMRGDQTVSLIQQYHAHYPEIARNTQDVEGRKQRVHMWAKITEELNAQYNTNFTVEQFKKKVQNVQCTSRQKIQSGKRNLGDAEMKYMRLFEQDRLNNISTFNNGNSDDNAASRTPIAAFTSTIAEDVNANLLVGKTKFFDMTLNGLSSNETDEINEDDGDHSTPSTSEAVSGFGMPAASNVGLNVLFGNTKPSQTTNLEQAQQLLLAMMTNNFSALTNGVDSSTGSATVAGDTLAKPAIESSIAIKNRSTVTDCRKRASSANAISDCSDNNNNNSGQNNVRHTIIGGDGQAPVKRRRKQPHAVHLSHLRPAESLLSFCLPGADGMKIDDTPSFCTGPAAIAKGGTVESRPGSVDLATSTLSPGADHRWRSDVVEMQKAILENQRRILSIVEKQTMILEERESRRPALAVATSESANSSNADKLDTLCGKIDVLATALSSIDSTLKTFLVSTVTEPTAKTAGAAEKLTQTDDVIGLTVTRLTGQPTGMVAVKTEHRRSMECIF